MKYRTGFLHLGQKIGNSYLQNIRRLKLQLTLAVGEKDWLEELVKERKLKRQKVMEAKSVCYLSGAPGKFSK